MRFESPLIQGTLLRRYKRFLADVRLGDGSTVTAHVANTGSMTGCAEPGTPAALSHHPGKGRKLPWSLQLVRSGEAWICVNTALPNRIVEEAVRGGRLRPLAGYPDVKREVTVEQGCRLDLVLERGDERCFVEVKNVTLRAGGRGARALFPDAVTARGTKHLETLRRLVARGERAALVLLVNRTDCTSVAPAWDIDPTWCEALVDAVGAGVEVLAYRTRIDLDGIEVARKVPLHLAHGQPPDLGISEG